jgi:hypothetical protein
MSNINFSIAYPDITWDAIAITGSEDSNFPLRNLFYGGSTVMWKRSGTATSTSITFDLGLSKSATANYCILRGVHHIVAEQGDRYGVSFQVRASSDNFSASDILIAEKNPIEIVGVKDEDALLLFNTSDSYRYWRVVINTDTAIQHSLRKLFLGNLFDFYGNSPFYPYSSNYTSSASAFVSDKGTLFKSSQGKKQKLISINWRNVTDQARDFFQKRIIESKDDSPLALIHKNDYHNPLSVYKKKKTLTDYKPVAWFDALDPTTLFNATSGGTLPAYGSSVARWENKATVNHATQATAGSRPIRATAPITGVRNVWSFSEPTDGSLISASNITYSSGNVDGFSSEAFFGDNSVSRTFLKGAQNFRQPLIDGVAYRLRVRIKMSDNSAPNFSGATGDRDFVFVRNNSESTGATVIPLANDVYEVRFQWTQGTATSVGIRKNTTNSNKTFWASGFTVEEQSVDVNLPYQRTLNYEVYEQGVPNRDYLFFDGSDDFLSANGLASVVQGDDTPFTIIAVSSPRDIAANGHIWSFGNSLGTNYYHFLMYGFSSSKIEVGRRGISSADSKLLTATNNFSNKLTNIISQIFDGQTGNIFTDGSLNGSGDLNIDTMATNSDLFTIGAFGRSTYSSYLKGNISALYVFDKALTEQDLKEIEYIISRDTMVANLSEPETLPTNVITAWINDYNIQSGENANLNNVNLEFVEDII